MKNNNYLKFAMMLTGSFVIMYSVMYLNADRFSHIFLNTTRLYMTLLMVSPMALLMLFFMRDMYKNKKANVAITITGIMIFALSLTFLRTQSFVSDKQYMKAMIPHHSSAILTSQEANIKDPEVKKLSMEIIKAQEEEIALMKKILDRME